MSLAITNQSSTIKFAWTNGEEAVLDKSNMSFRIRGRWLYVSENHDFININKVLKIRYTEVTSPVVASNDALVTELLSYKATQAEVVGKVVLTDGTNDVALEPNGSLPVTLQDQTTPLIITKFSLLEQATTTTAGIAIGDYIIPVADATGIVAGKMITIFDPDSVRFSIACVLSVSVLNVTICTPMDFAYPSGSYVDISDPSLAVNGSVTPVVFGIRNNAGAVPPPGVELSMDVTRILFSCITSSAPQLDEFGDITALLRGLVLRKRDGTYNNIFNIKTNGDLAGIMYDFTTVSGFFGATNGFYSRLTFGGQSKFGSLPRLDINEDLELIVQDDLTALTRFEVIAEGSIVQP